MLEANRDVDAAKRSQIDGRRGAIAIVHVVWIAQAGGRLAIVEADDLVSLHDVRRREENGIDGQDQRRVEAGAERDRQDDGAALGRMAQQQPRAEPEIATEGRHAREAPRVARALAKHRGVAEQPAGLVLRFARLHAAIDERLAPQLQVHPHLVGQPVVEAATDEGADAPNPPGGPFP